MISYGKQNLDSDDIKSVIKVLKSDFLTQGPVVQEFENCISSSVQATHATAFNSATSALHAACLAIGIKKGDLVWTSPISFVASANCAIYCGATIDFVDIDLETRNISISKLREKLELANNQNLLPKAIICVHFGGLSCDMATLKAECDRFNIRLIEDASHAVGANRPDGPVGDCRYSDVTVFSFHAVKIITCGEGGVALTNSDEINQKLNLFKSHGVTRSKDLFLDKSNDDEWYYEQIDLGFNYRMTDIQAALGLSQLKKLKQFVFTRNKIYEKYNTEFSDSNLLPQLVPKDYLSAQHLYTIVLGEDLDRDYIFKSLKKLNIGVNLHYIPIYRHPYFRNKFDLVPNNFPSSEEYFKRAMTIPLHPGLLESDINYIIKCLKNMIE